MHNTNRPGIKELLRGDGPRFENIVPKRKKWKLVLPLNLNKRITMIRYLLDTNVVSELRRNKPHAAVVSWMNTLRDEQVFISAVTMGELQDGVQRTRKLDIVKATEIEAWLVRLETSFSLISMNVTCFREWSRLMEGRSSSMEMDAMIAATARVHGLTIATRNEKDFRHLGVDIVNPFKAT